MKARIAHWFLDYVHITAKDLGEAEFQVIQPTEVVESRLREARTKANGHIDIASAILTARQRAEQGKSNHTSGSKVGLVYTQGRNHLIPNHNHILAQAACRDQCSTLQREALMQLSCTHSLPGDSGPLAKLFTSFSTGLASAVAVKWTRTIQRESKQTSKVTFVPQSDKLALRRLLPVLVDRFCDVGLPPISSLTS